MFCNSLTISSPPFPLLCKEGQGEVEAWNPHGQTVLPLLSSPYKGEGKNTVAPVRSDHSVNACPELIEGNE